MAYVNLSVITKQHRLSQVNIDLASAYLMIYTGTYPDSPDIPVSTTLLAALPCGNPFGVLSYVVQSATIRNGGSGGVSGTRTVTGTTGTGTPFQATVTVSGGAITAIQAIALPGAYSVLPTLYGEVVTGASLVNASFDLNCSVVLTASPIAQQFAIGSGTAGFARLAYNNTSGAAGVIDLDIGTSGASAIINSTSITSGGPVVCTLLTIAEG